MLAYAATAVPATMDGGGVLYDTRDPFEIARLMEAVVDDERVTEAVMLSQDAALERLRQRDFDGTLLRYVEQALSAPPRPAPEVAWDFWQQFDQFERLEELRQFRPALYRALPPDPQLATRDSRLVNMGAGESPSDREPRAASREPRP